MNKNVKNKHIKNILFETCVCFIQTGLPHSDPHTNDDMEIKPGIAEMIREEERVRFFYSNIHKYISFIAINLFIY